MPNSVTAVIGPSPVVLVSKSMMCPDCSPPKTNPPETHAFQHVAVADGGALERDAARLQRALETDIAHDRSDDRIAGYVPRIVQRRRDRIHHVIAA